MAEPVPKCYIFCDDPMHGSQKDKTMVKENTEEITEGTVIRSSPLSCPDSPPPSCSEDSSPLMASPQAAQFPVHYYNY